MKSAFLVVGVIALVVILGLGWAVSVGNRLVGMDQAVQESWAQVQTAYQQRADLVPNLVETVKGFAAQERTVLEEVTRARASVAGIKVTPEVLNDPAQLRKFQEAQSQLGGALSRLLVTVERYPELKSNQNFLALQNQLESIENRVAVERRRFNESVRAYNTTVRSFPASLVASFRGFGERPFFEATPGSQAAPQIKF
jgi:LemA protein